MDVMVIGGAGKQGAGAAGILARKEDVSRVLLADIDTTRLETVADGIGEKAQPVHLDLNNTEELSQLLGSLSGLSVLLNAAGPGYRFGPPVMQACVDAGVNYVDLQDDADAVSSVSAFDETAKQAQVTMVLGAGLSPGLSNVLSRLGSDQVNLAQEVRIFWVANMTAAPTVANWGHRIAMWGSTVPVVEGGEPKEVPGGTGDIVIEWPMPAGKVVERLCAHPEPLTLVEHLEGIQKISVRGGFTPREHDELLSLLGELGLTSREGVDIGDVTVTPIEFLSKYAVTDSFRTSKRFRQLVESEERIGDHNGLRVEVLGVRDGKQLMVSYQFFSQDRNEGIYTPAGVIAHMVARKEIEAHGVNWPEALSPELIVARLREEGIQIRESEEEMQL